MSRAASVMNCSGFWRYFANVPGCDALQDRAMVRRVSLRLLRDLPEQVVAHLG
jgi:hypothetical protein